MKNHWLELHDFKENRWWTAEFAKNAVFQLKSRRVSLLTNLTATNNSVNNLSTRRICKILFQNSTFSVSDKELLDFLSSASKDMTNMYARMRRFQGNHPYAIELENFELKNLVYDSVGVGSQISDLEFSFTYKSIQSH